jgi:hypothetical protein
VTAAGPGTAANAASKLPQRRQQQQQQLEEAEGRHRRRASSAAAAQEYAAVAGSLPELAGVRVLVVSQSGDAALEAAPRPHALLAPGRAAAWNAGAGAAAGRVLLFTSDDALLPRGWDAAARGAVADEGRAAGGPAGSAAPAVVAAFPVDFDAPSMVHADDNALSARLRLAVAALAVRASRRAWGSSGGGALGAGAPQAGALVTTRAAFSGGVTGPFPRVAAGTAVGGGAGSDLALASPAGVTAPPPTPPQQLPPLLADPTAHSAVVEAAAYGALLARGVAQAGVTLRTLPPALAVGIDAARYDEAGFTAALAAETALFAATATLGPAPAVALWRLASGCAGAPAGSAEALVDALAAAAGELPRELAPLSGGGGGAASLLARALSAAVTAAQFAAGATVIVAHAGAAALAAGDEGDTARVAPPPSRALATARRLYALLPRQLLAAAALLAALAVRAALIVVPGLPAFAAAVESRLRDAYGQQPAHHRQQLAEAFVPAPPHSAGWGAYLPSAAARAPVASQLPRLRDERRPQQAAAAGGAPAGVTGAATAITTLPLLSPPGAPPFAITPLAAATAPPPPSASPASATTTGTRRTSSSTVSSSGTARARRIGMDARLVSSFEEDDAGSSGEDGVDETAAATQLPSHAESSARAASPPLPLLPPPPVSPVCRALWQGEAASPAVTMSASAAPQRHSPPLQQQQDAQTHVQLARHLFAPELTLGGEGEAAAHWREPSPVAGSTGGAPTPPAAAAAAADAAALDEGRDSAYHEGLDAAGGNGESGGTGGQRQQEEPQRHKPSYASAVIAGGGSGGGDSAPASAGGTSTRSAGSRRSYASVVAGSAEG